MSDVTVNPIPPPRDLQRPAPEEVIPAKASSNRKIIYRCTRCGQEHDRESITVKRAVFKEMGEHGRTLRSRVTDWLCPSCRDVDPGWTQEKLSAAPGMADTKLAHE